MPTVTRRVGKKGLSSFAAVHYRAGVWLAGENVTLTCDGGFVHLHHRGVLVATHAGKHRVDKQSAGLGRGARSGGGGWEESRRVDPLWRETELKEYPYRTAVFIPVRGLSVNAERIGEFSCRTR